MLSANAAMMIVSILMESIFAPFGGMAKCQKYGCDASWVAHSFDYNPMKTTLSIIFLMLLPFGLFAKDKSAPTREKLAVSTVAWTGQKLPAYPSGQPEISVLKVTIPPGQRLPMHKHPFINAVVVLRGELTVTTGKGKILHVKAGHPMIEVVNEWHYGANHGTEPVEMIAFYAGIKGTPITIPQK
jgi:quercetin dioxygenase-like cupin family protein